MQRYYKKMTYAKKMQQNVIFLPKNLVISKKSSTFALGFEKNTLVLSSSGLGQRPLTP